MKPLLTRLHGREANVATWRWNLAKTLAQTVCFWGFFLFVAPAAIYAAETAFGLESWRFASEKLRWVGVGLFIVAGTLGLTSGAVMAVSGRGTPLPSDCPRALVVVGPYRYLRNPMAVAGLAQGVAVGIYLGSPTVIAYAIAGGPAWDWLVRPWEEADLERRFGDEFRKYRRAVPCWIPRLTGYAPLESNGAEVDNPTPS